MKQDTLSKQFRGDLARQGGLRRISRGDAMFAESVVKRQKLIIKDLVCLNETYPGIIDRDTVGGLYALCAYLEDEVASLVGRALSAEHFVD